MKNIVFIIGSKKEHQHSVDSWKHFCEKHNAELLLMEHPVMDINNMPIEWQKYFLFDILDHNEIKYDQILIVDSKTIVHSECPNFFEKTNHEYCMVHHDGNYESILRRMEHYKRNTFDNDWFDFWEYGNSGFQIVNKKHRPFFDAMREFYFDKTELIQSIYSGGTDQTPLNFMLRKHDINIKLLPWKYNMTYMSKREVIGDDMLHTKMGYVMNFSDLSDYAVPHWMEKTYKYLYD